VSVITIKYTSLLLLPTCSDACLLSSGSLVHVPGTVTFILPSSDAISFRSVESRCNRSRSDWIMLTSIGMLIIPSTRAMYPKISPVVAMPLPPGAPPDLRIFARAMWLQITAGIAVNSQPHVNERTAKMRLQIATGGVRETVCATAGCGGGGVSSAVAPL
jgi:hypothetical protein